MSSNKSDLQPVSFSSQPVADHASSLLAMDQLLDGSVHTDRTHKMLYAQDASVYQEEPTGVVFPRTLEDLQRVVQMATQLNLSLIPRAAGTSLAGQCVGDGLVVDTGRYMNQILELNVEERWVRVQPGVILDDLNRFLAPHGLFFGPDTSTASRCMIGGMVGNNSCGSHSILYGTTRDHVLELEVVFMDGVVERISPWDDSTLNKRLQVGDALGRGLAKIDAILKEHKDLIDTHYPRKDVVRRNTGYALDELLQMSPYTEGGAPFSLNRLLCGSEGTLCLTSEIKLNLVDKPTHRAVVCAHFNSLEESLRATVIAVKHDPAAVELMDRRIMDLAQGNIEQRRNSFFVEGSPEAILAVEFYTQSQQELDEKCAALIDEFKSSDMGYAFPRVNPPDDSAVWSLRKAGLGILMGVPGDVKPVTVVEDTAVAVDVLPDYIREFSEIMDRHETQCVYYAHASVGELHLRPELNIKDPEDVDKFLSIAREVTDLVKKYGGSISGEHGDGRLRSPMLEQFYGEELAQLHRELKAAFDPHKLLNPGKIVDAAPMEESWRFIPGEETPEVETFFNWDADQGLVRAIEKCNGAGACRKRAEAGGTMCPSYMATLNEKDSTRGRANVFRHLVRENMDPREAMASEELYDVMDLCLSCKGCKSECPASVDMGKMKAEFLQHYYDAHGTPLSARLFANYGKLSKLAMLAPAMANFSFKFPLSKALMSRVMGISTQREFPAYAKRPFREIYREWEEKRALRAPDDRPVVGLYVDPFTEYTEPWIAVAATRVLDEGGYNVQLIDIEDDGRTYLSKGLIREVKPLMNANMRKAQRFMDRYPGALVVGLEPSALLTFRDEVPDLVDDALRPVAEQFASRCVLLDEFVVQMSELGEFNAQWRKDVKGEKLVLHGHCHQKSMVGLTPTVKALQLAGYDVESLKTGCCGMAGSFGYEAKHYDLSMQVGELVLFPELRKREGQVHGVVAPGTSCRHQIKDGVGQRADHPAIWLERALDRVPVKVRD